jgi:hypothetical protein
MSRALRALCALLASLWLVAGAVRAATPERPGCASIDDGSTRAPVLGRATDHGSRRGAWAPSTWLPSRHALDLIRPYTRAPLTPDGAQAPHIRYVTVRGARAPPV